MDRTFPRFRNGMADRVRHARGDLSQDQLAELTRYTQQMISRYENGRIPKAFWFLAGLSEAGIDVDWLLTGRRRKRAGKTRLPRPSA
jgi:transcriptional regulator with XRE-family HTH domain